MKMKNKQDETRILGYNKRSVYIAIAIVVMLIVLTGFFLYRSPSRPIQPKAAIIDQLSSSELTPTSRFPNQTFVETAKGMLYKRFPQVDYYSDNATVDRYKSLPSLGYRLIIWRAHSALDEDYFIAISSSEMCDPQNYPQKYNQYSSDQLTLCNITGDPNLYFAITPKFVEECMSGRFEDTVVVLMSCNGLKERYTKTAQAFIEKGVKAFISWDGWIDSASNDQAITLLLDYLIDKNNTIGEAVHKTPSYSSEPYGRSTLDYYPRPGVANYCIPNYREANTVNNARPAVITVFSRAKSESKCAFQPRISPNQNTMKPIL